MRWSIDRRIGPTRRSAWALAVVMGAFLAGCGGEGTVKVGALHPVKGKVTLPDGKPLGPARVVFEGPVSSTTTTESDGTFSFKGDGAGLPAGDYKVRLEVAGGTGSLKKPVVPFPQKYLDADTSDLTATVKPEGPNDFDFKLTKGDAKVDESPRGGQGPAKVRD